MTCHDDDSPEVCRLLDELAELSAEIHAQEARYERRLAIYRALTAAGITQARMAKVAGVTHLAVSAALRKADRQENP